MFLSGPSSYQTEPLKHMHRPGVRFSALLIALVSLLLVYELSSAADGAISDRFRQMDTLVQSRMKASSIPGGGYAVVENGEVVHMAAFGTACLKDNRPLTVQTPMMIGSVGKTITALAVQQLSSAGKLDLAAPVTRYLPWFELTPPGAANGITVQNLLDHTSGLSQFDGQNLPRVYRPGLTPYDVARGLRSIKPVHAPGEVYEYSNLNFILLGVVIEAVSGQRYGDYIDKHIFDPLGMDHSTVDYAAARADGLTDGHHYLFGIPVAYEEPFPSGVVPAGYHITAIEDMAHYVATLSNSGVYQGRSMLTPDGRPGKSTLTLNSHWEPSYEFNRYDSTGHSGANLNANAAIEYMPRERLGVVVMYNANPYQFLNLADSASDMTNDLLRMYLGIEELRPRSPSTRTVYTYINGVLLVILAAAAVNALRLRTWAARLQKARSRAWFLARTILMNGMVPVAILLGMLLLMRFNNSAPFLEAWPTLILLLPDIAWTLLVVAFVLLLVGSIKAARLYVKRPQPHE